MPCEWLLARRGRARAYQLDLGLVGRGVLLGRVAEPLVPGHAPDDAEQRRTRRTGAASPCRSIARRRVKGVAVAPSAWPMQTAPIARPRCAAGNQRETVEALFGIAPASPAPKSIRTTKSEAKPTVAAVSIVKADHQSTMRVSALRVPKRSPNQPVGHLEERVGEGERAVDVAHLHRREVELLHDGRPRDRDAEAVEVGERRQRHEQTEHLVTRVRRRRRPRPVERGTRVRVSLTCMTLVTSSAS